MLKKLALIVGIVFVVLGLLGFVPGITTTDSAGMPLLFGLFMVGAVHNIIHLASGIAAWLCMKTETVASLYFKVIGVIYALVTIIGFVQGSTVLGLFSVNVADNILHLVFAVVFLGIGFGMRPAGATVTKVSV